MSTIKEIYVEAKKSKNFQTYTVGMRIDLGFKEDAEPIIKEAQANCRRMAQEQIKLDSGNSKF